MVDGVERREKASALANVTSLDNDQVTVQDAESFCQLASSFCDRTIMIHVTKEEVCLYRTKNPFADSVPVNGSSKMHVFWSDSKNTYFYQIWPERSLINPVSQSQASYLKRLSGNKELYYQC